jgi:hemerythrin
MALIQWDSGFSVEVAEIDKQHQKLFDMINELYDAIGKGRGRNMLGKTFHDLITYAGTHFETEERYFLQFQYPAYEEHLKEHAEFVNKVVAFRDQFDGGSFTITVEVAHFLKDWLVLHIQGTDRRYALFFKEQGLR